VPNSKAYMRAYNSTEKAKAAKHAYSRSKEGRSKQQQYMRAYNSTEKAKAAKRAYDKSEKGKKHRQLYSKTEKYKAIRSQASSKYNKTEKRKAAAHRYAVTEKRKESGRRYFYKTTYGITLEDFKTLIARQDGKCACCGGTLTPIGYKKNKMQPCLDHDHATNAIRAVLCLNCNFVLGYAGESVDVLSRAIRYLSFFKQKIAVAT
jgi:hypothetical protein